MRIFICFRHGLLSETEVSDLGGALINIYEPELIKVRTQLAEARFLFIKKTFPMLKNLQFLFDFQLKTAAAD